MNIAETKKIIQDLYSKSQSISDDFDKKSTSIHLIQPFFEALGWDFQTDVKTLIDDNIADKAFKIDGVTRFYLKVLPHGTSIESSRKSIESLTSYAYNKGVTWAVATNFKEMRVYNTEAPGSSLASMQHYSFNESDYVKKFDDYLSDLTKHQFSVNVLDADAEYFGKKPKRVPIDKQLLKDLLSFRNLLVTSIIKNNSIKEEDAEPAAQKILNRLIFIRSCGDRKIEERHLKASLSDWKQDKSKKLIEYLREIFAHFNERYGSTLFEKHQCDSLMIHDGVLEDVINGLYRSKEKAIEYNFAHIEHDSLGKMYENYLGTVQQKKDGAYYTPSYISKYICENTIIPYLSKLDVTTIPELISEYENNFEELESKIHNIKILDPACGTGEFLIRAVDVLLKISKEIQKKKQDQGQYQHSVKKKKSGLATFQTFDMDIENQQLRAIIQNNIHGVDMNEEAIEIAQLNIFLKLATSSQQLLDLSKNLRIGNSLIDDPSVDPKAFDWEKEFPEKFDVVIGNPPYVRQEKIKSIKPYLEKSYSVYTGVADLYVYFFELGTKLLKENAVLNYIISNKWMKANYGKNTRNHLVNYYIDELIDFGDTQIFDGATTYPCIIKLKNKNKMNSKIKSTIIENNRFGILKNYIKKNSFFLSQSNLKSESWNFQNLNSLKIFNRITTNCDKLGDLIGKKANRGILSGADSIFILNEKQKNAFIKKDPNCRDLIKPHLSGKEVQRYHIDSKNNYILLIKKGTDITKYPTILEYLKPHKQKLENRSDKGEWYSLRACAYYEEFSKPKIIYGKVATGPRFTFDQEGYIINTSNYMLSVSDIRLLGILNSKLGWFFVKNTCTYLNGGFGLLWIYLKNIPITKIKSLNLEKLVLNILNLNKELQNESEDIKKSSIMKEITKIDSLIEQEVYKLYGITDEEKAIIESSI